MAKATLDAKLASALKTAKSTSMFFALIAKGSDGMLIVDKKKIAAKEIADGKKECGGGTLYQGKCQGEEGGNTLVFEVAKEAPATLNSVVKKIIKESAGLTMGVQFRVNAGAENEADENEGQAIVSPAPAPPPPAPPPPAPTQVPEAQRFAERLKVLAAEMPKESATGSPQAQDAKAKVGEANAAFRKNDYAQANALLDQAESLLKQAVASAAKPAAAAPPKPAPAPAAKSAPNPRPPAVPPAAPPSPEQDAQQAEWERRVMAIEPRVLEAKKARPNEAKWMTLLMSVQDLGSEGKFPQALAALNKLDALLNAAPAADGAGLQAWTAARTAVADQLKKLSDAFKASKQPEADQAIILLQAVLKNLTVRPATREQVVGMERYLQTDDVIPEAEMPNPFGFTVSIRAPLMAAIAELKKNF